MHNHFLPISLLILIHNKVNVNFKNTDIIKLYWNIKAWKWIFLWLVASTITKHLNSLKVASTGNKMEFSQAGSASAISFHKFSCTPRKLFHRKFSNFFWIFFLLLTSLWFFISILHSYVTTNICAKQCSNVLFTLLYFKYHNQKLQFKYFSWKLITVWKYLQHTWLYDILNYLSENWTDKKLIMLQLCFFKQNISILLFSYDT